MLSVIIGDFLPYIVIALGAVGAFFGYTRSVRKKAESDIRGEMHEKSVNEYIRNVKEINSAKPIDSNVDNVRDRLRKRQAKRNN